MNKSSLLEQIEQCRKEMITLSDLYGINSDIVIQSSKRLDDLLNQYQMINYRKLAS